MAYFPNCEHVEGRDCVFYLFESSVAFNSALDIGGLQRFL